MRVSFLILLITVLMIGQMGASRAEAFIFINEFLADPASGSDGDANSDGTRHTYEDEFVELFNSSADSIDISDWYISDSVSARHYFEAGTTIEAYSTFVVFGGGDEDLMPDNWQVASVSYLYLNNGIDTITLYDDSNQVVDFYSYGYEGPEADDNQSIVRNPEGSKGEWGKHTALPNADGKLFSPGYLVNEIPSQSTVPEPATVLYLAFGLSSMLLVRKK